MRGYSLAVDKQRGSQRDDHCLGADGACNVVHPVPTAMASRALGGSILIYHNWVHRPPSAGSRADLQRVEVILGIHTNLARRRRRSRLYEAQWVQALLRPLAVFGEIGLATGLVSGIEDAASLLAGLIRRGLMRRSSGDGIRWSLVRPLADYLDYETGLSSSHRLMLHVRAAQEGSP